MLERRDIYAPKWEHLDDVREWAAPIWRAERGRYGRASASEPAIVRPHRGQRRALAHYDGRISLPRWSRSPWVVLHELAHHLALGDHHGPRFVGVLIGLVCRHLNYHSTDLMQIADQHGVKYAVRSIGSVPVHGLRWRAVKALHDEGPMSPMDLACWLSIGTYHEPVTERHVRGAMLGPLLAGQASFSRGKYRLAPCPALPDPAVNAPRRRPEGFSRFHRVAGRDARPLFAA
jgi:hypothetical protein